MNRKSRYQEKLLDPRWQKKRLKILERDQWACQGCFDTQNTLHVHHKYYLPGEPWDVPDTALVTLCVDCHEEEGRAQEKALRDLQRALYDAGALSFNLDDLTHAFEDSPVQCGDYHWSVISHTIKGLLTDAARGGPKWQAATEDYHGEIKKRMEGG